MMEGRVEVMDRRESAAEAGRAKEDAFERIDPVLAEETKDDEDR